MRIRAPRIAAVALIIAGTAHAGSVLEADELYRSGKYAEAARELTELTLEDPGDSSLYDRLGAARYRAGDYEGAARAWDEAARLRGGTDEDTLFNSGNAHYQAGRLEEALERYDRVLERAPSHPGASQNKEMLVQELERRRQEQPPPPPKQGEGDRQEPPEGGEQQQQQPQQQGEGEGESESGGQGQPQDPQEQEQEPGSQQRQSPGSGQAGNPENTEGPGVADLDEVEPSDGEQAEAPAGQGGGTDGYEESEPITPGEADRLLDGVEEGEHRVRIGGNGGGPPW